MTIAHTLKEDAKFSNQNIHSRDYEDLIVNNLDNLLKQAKLDFKPFYDGGGGLEYNGEIIKGVDILYEFQDDDSLAKAKKVFFGRFNTNVLTYNNNCIAFNLKRVSNSANYPYAHGGDVSMQLKNKLIKKDPRLYPKGIPQNIFFGKIDSSKVNHEIKDKINTTLCIELTKELFFSLFYEEIASYFSKQQNINWIVFINNDLYRNKFKVINPNLILKDFLENKQDVKLFKLKDYKATYLVKFRDSKFFWVGNVHRGITDKKFYKVEWKIANELLLEFFEKA